MPLRSLSSAGAPERRAQAPGAREGHGVSMAYITTQNSFNWLKVNGREHMSCGRGTRVGMLAHLYRTEVLIPLLEVKDESVFCTRVGEERQGPRAPGCNSTLPALRPITHCYRFQHLPGPAHASTEASTRVGCKNTHLSHHQHFNYPRVEYKALGTLCKNLQRNKPTEKLWENSSKSHNIAYASTSNAILVMEQHFKDAFHNSLDEKLSKYAKYSVFEVLVSVHMF